MCLWIMTYEAVEHIHALLLPVTDYMSYSVSLSLFSSFRRMPIPETGKLTAASP